MWAFLQTIGISILIIVLLHYGWEYMKNTYSIRKTKDLVKIQTDKYDSILSELFENKGYQEETIDVDEMENDLALFLEQSISETP